MSKLHKVKNKKIKVPKIFPLLLESVEYAKLTPYKKEFAKAVLRFAIEYACMRQAGFEMVKDDKRKIK